MKDYCFMFIIFFLHAAECLIPNLIVKKRKYFCNYLVSKLPVCTYLFVTKADIKKEMG